MINKDTFVTVINKYNGTVGYDVPDLEIHRNFYPGEIKEISFNELERLSFVPGGDIILKDFLEIQNEEAIERLFSVKPQPEYYYTKEDIKKLMETGTLDQFLDCLDFAPAAVKQMIKDLAVNLPLNDVAKRKAIFEKLDFDVTRAIEIKNTDYDGGDSANVEIKEKTVNRRAAPMTGEKQAPTPSGRRYQPAKK